MAFVPTLLGTATDTNTTTTIVTGVLSPTANSLLVVACSMGAGQTTDFTFTSIVDTFIGTGAWTQYTISGVDATNTRYYRTAIFVAIAGSAPLTGTITVTASANNTRKDIAAYEVTTGYNATTPVKQSQTGENEASPLTLTLGATPDTDSMVFAAIGAAIEVSGITPGTNFTELDEVDAGNFNQQTQYDDASATTTVDWSSLSARQHTGVAIEIDATPSSASASISPSVSTSPSPSPSVSPSISPSISPSSSISPSASISPSVSASPSAAPEQIVDLIMSSGIIPFPR